MRSVSATSAMVAMFLLSAPVFADGDSINLRLDGADAFEARQTCTDAAGLKYPCGGLATEVLSALLQLGPLRCERTGWSYDRPVMRCTVELDVSCELVRQGWAVVDPRYSKRCQPQQDAAKLEKRGAWAGTFVSPSTWRAGGR